MPRIAWCPLLFALALPVVPFAWGDEKKDEKKGDFKLTDDEQALIDLANAERKKADTGLKPLKMSPKLMEAARKHAANMAKQDKLDHTLDEKGPADRAKAAGYKSRFVGENIGWGYETPKETVAAWMESKPHRENILFEKYTEIGAATAKTAKGERYWVQVFGKP